MLRSFLSPSPERRQRPPGRLYSRNGGTGAGNDTGRPVLDGAGVARGRPQLAVHHRQYCPDGSLRDCFAKYQESAQVSALEPL